MAKEKIESEVVGRLTIRCRELKGKRYGAVPVDATIGGTSLGDDLFAVVCDTDKWVSTRADCERWLTGHGLTETEATLVIDMGKLFDENRRLKEREDLAAQEERGLFDEEVGKIIDGVMEDLKAGAYGTRDDLAWAVSRATGESSYCRVVCLAAAAVSRDTGKLFSAARDVLYEAAYKELERRPEYWGLP